MALRTVGVRLTAEVSDYRRKMLDAAKSTRDLKGEMDRAAKSGRLDALADSALGLGAALAAPAAAAVKLSMDFEKSMSAVSAATHASAKDLDQLRRAAIEAGKDTQYSATEAADAITELSKAGVTTADVLGGGLDGALDLAAAGQLDVAEAAETAASAMVQFQLKGKDVPHIADLLAAAAGKAQGSVHDMGYALNQSGLVASQFGLSIEDTTGALAEFANAGLIGSDAGTSFKTMLLAMANPSGVTKRVMDELGLSFYDAQGKFKGLSGVAAELHDKLGHLSEEQRQATLGQIYGSDAIRAATVLYRDGAKGVEEWRAKVDDAGYASETAAKLTDNLAGDIERLKGSLETLAIEAGGGANSGLRVLAKGAEALVDEIGALPPAVSGGVTVLAGLSGALLLAGAGWVKARRANAAMLEELRGTGPAGTRAAAGLQSATKWAGRAAAAFVAFEVAQAAISQFQTELNPQVEALASGLADFGKSGQLAGESSRVLGGDLDKLTGTFKLLADESNTRRDWARGLQSGLEGLVPGLKGTETSLARTKERIGAMDQALAQLVSGGRAAEAAVTFDKLGQALAVDGVSMEEFRKQFPQYAAAVEVAGKQTDKTADAVSELGGSAQQSSGQVMALSKSIDELFQQEMSADRAALNLADSTDALTKELLKGKRTLALNTEEGRKNRAAVLDQLEAIERSRDARVRGGETLEKASALYRKDIEGLRNIMKQAGFTTSAIDGLIGKYEDIPEQVTTKVSATGVAATEAQLKRLSVYQQALKKGIIPAGFHGPIVGPDGKAYAEGGWTGPGGKWDAAGVVHADEFVIKKESRRKIEQSNPGLLDEMNATGQMPGYARGGRVAMWPFPTTGAMTKVPTRAQVAAAVMPDFGSWPSSPSAQRGDSGVWRQILAMIRAAGIPFTFGNGYRPGDPLWHGSGRADDLMGYNQDRLATFLAGKRPLELIHRTNSRDYAYTRGQNRGSFNEALMEAHRNHVHIAMKNGGLIQEPVFGVGASGATYSFGENYVPERVVPMTGGGGGNTVHLTVVNHGVIGSRAETEAWLTDTLDNLKRRGKI